MITISYGKVLEEAEKSDATMEDFTQMLWVGLYRNKRALKDIAKELKVKNVWYEVYYELHRRLFSHITYYID